MNDYQALADIRRNEDAVKSLLDKYGRYRYAWMILNSINAVIVCVCLIDVVEKDVRLLTLLYLLTLFFKQVER